MFLLQHLDLSWFLTLFSWLYQIAKSGSLLGLTSVLLPCPSNHCGNMPIVVPGEQASASCADAGATVVFFTHVLQLAVCRL